MSTPGSAWRSMWGRWIRSQDVILTLSRLMKLYGKPASIVPGRPWQDGYLESFHGKLREECLNREWFRDVREAKVVIERRPHCYNHQCPHSALGYRAPAQARQAWINGRNIEAGLTA